MRDGEQEELNLGRLDAALTASLAGLSPSPGFERSVLERVDALAARRAWVRSVILDGVGCAGLAVAAFAALDYVLAQPDVQAALPQVGVYGAWAAGGFGLAFVLWSGLKAQPR
jgi:predicted naringenin-chalcone synthase